jgi:large subunit ribosomal protein L9
MAMEVILREHVEHLGRRGEIVKVADGYARNYLLPRKLALAVTAENKKQIERERVKAEAREAEELTMAQAFAARVEAVELVVGRRVGENDTLYGSVTSADIAEALGARSLTVDRRKIQLAEPLKTLGDHVVAVKVHRDVTAQVRIKVVADTGDK